MVVTPSEVLLYVPNLIGTSSVWHLNHSAPPPSSASLVLLTAPTLICHLRPLPHRSPHLPPAHLPSLSSSPGYARAVLTFVSYYYAISNWQLSAGCYFISFTLDYFDGLFARMLNQSKGCGGEHGRVCTCGIK